MKKFSFGYIVLIVSIFLVPQASSQPPATTSSHFTIDEIVFESKLEQQKKFLGNRNHGDYQSGNLNFQINSGHQTLYCFSLLANDFRKVDLAGLDANATEVSVGGTVPTSKQLQIRLIYNSWSQYGTRITDQAGGIYLDYQPNSLWQFEYGTEMFFHQAPQVYFLRGAREFLFVQLTGGFSKHYVQEEGVEHHFEDRFELGTTITLGPILLNLGFGTRTDPFSWKSETRAWTVGFGLTSFNDSSIFAPEVYLSYREKPGSRHLIGIGSFGGREISYAISPLFSSCHQTLLIPTRVVRNQNFNIRVLNQHTQEFGLIAYSFAWFEFDINDQLSCQNYKGSIYFTGKGCDFHGFADPFIGYTFSDLEEITFNPAMHQLQNIGHIQHTIDFGGRFKVKSTSEKSHKKGYLRLNCTIIFSSQDIEGGSLGATFWF